jgi:hypothetical protein
MKRQNSAIILVIVIFISGFVFATGGCNSIDSRYFTMLDSLDGRLQQTSNLLEIDYQTIKVRQELIDDHLRLIKTYVNDTISADLGMQLTKYKGIKKVYGKFLSEYSACHKEYESLVVQSKNLRTAVQRREITKEDFKIYYLKEKNDGIDNFHRAQKLIQPIHSVEPDYQRISSLVDEKLNTMAKTNPALAQVLKEFNK